MANRLQHLRGSEAEHSTFTGAKGEISLVTDTSADRIPTGEVRIHDGTTAGGLPLTLGTTSKPLTNNIVLGSGVGINFNNYGSEDSNSATTVGSNLLDDYEEGTFQATLEYDTNLTGTFGNITTTSGISGNYTKIGNQVFVKYETILKNSHTGTNDALLNSISLPFVTNGLAHYSIYGYNLYGRYTTTILNYADLMVSTGSNNSKLYFTASAGTSNGGSGYVVLTNTCHINVIYTTLD